MDSLQQALSVVLVLGVLGATLWWLRRKGVATFNIKNTRGKDRSMKVLERIALTPQHSLHLVKVADRTVLIAASPGGCSILDTNSAAPETAEPNR